MKLAVIGNIGAGKTTLVKNIARLYSIPTFLEQADAPFFELFSRDRAKWSLTFHLHLLHERLANHLLCEMKGGILDRVFWETRIFAQVLVDSGEMTTEEFALINLRTNEVSKLVQENNFTFIYLKCTPEVCFERIKARGRNYEREIDLPYLKRLDRHYADLRSLTKGKNIFEIETTLLNDQEVLNETVSRLKTDRGTIP